MVYQVISVIGAVMILIAYAGNQRGWMGREDRVYNVLNFVGSGLLAWVAVADRRAGFIFLEGAWALLSIPGMLARKAAPTA